MSIQLFLKINVNLSIDDEQVKCTQSLVPYYIKEHNSGEDGESVIQQYNFASIAGSDLQRYELEDLTEISFGYKDLMIRFKWLTEKLNSTLSNRLPAGRKYQPGGSRLVIMATETQLTMTLLNTTSLPMKLSSSGLILTYLSAYSTLQHPTYEFDLTFHFSGSSVIIPGVI